jgi:hypothetical protein
MPNVQHVLKHIGIQQQKIIGSLLPNVCQIYPSSGANVQITGPGIRTSDTPQARVWRDSRSGLDTTDIPCSLLIERAFVPGKLHEQATVVSRNVLNVPVSMRYNAETNPNGVKPDDRVVVNGRKYEIRKIADQSLYDATLELTVVEISTEYDHP